MPRVLARVEAVLTGRAVDYTRPGSRSAIAKRPRQGPVLAGPEGLDGDEQGDRRVHGGPDKAIHHYPHDHYAAWRAELGPHPLLEAPGAFGENISTRGVTEADLCLGDRLRLGAAVVEVSQGRQPCWKLSDRFGIADLARRVQDSGRTGWYYRVLEEGVAAPGDSFTLEERLQGAVSLDCLWTTWHRHRPDAERLRTIARAPGLTPAWVKKIDDRLAWLAANPPGATDGAA